MKYVAKIMMHNGDITTTILDDISDAIGYAEFIKAEGVMGYVAAMDGEDDVAAEECFQKKMKELYHTVEDDLDWADDIAEAYDDGYEEGYTEGYDEGYVEGYEEGYDDAYEELSKDMESIFAIMKWLRE